MTSSEILIFGGFDPSAGAGILADLRVAKSLDFCGHPILTSLALQNNQEFISLRPFSTEEIMLQFSAGLIKSRNFLAAKIGALGSFDEQGEPWTSILKTLRKNKNVIVVDPVMRSSSGGLLVAPTSEQAIRQIYGKTLAPACSLLTPNHPEAHFLLNEQRPLPPEEVLMRLFEKMHCNILLKGGHGDSNAEVIDYLCWNGKIERFPHARSAHREIRGTGCALSTALAIFLAKNPNPVEAVHLAIETVQTWIQQAREVSPQIFHLL